MKQQNSIRNDYLLPIILNFPITNNIINTSMKIVFKRNDNVKMYSGEISFLNMLNFVRQNYSGIENYQMSFEDEDRDQVMIASQDDVQIMLEMFQSKNIIKVTVEDGSNVGKQQDLEIQGEQIVLSPFHSKSVEKQEANRQITKEQNRSCSGRSSSSNKSNKSNKSIEEREKSQQKKKNKKKVKQGLNKLEDLIDAKLNSMIQQKISIVVPCIINQLSKQSKQENKKKEKGGKTHEDVACTGCSVSPIVGIRYKCQDCYVFNLCEKCEENVEHPHNLLKMKYPEVEDDHETYNCSEFMKEVKKVIKKCTKNVLKSKSRSPKQPKQPREQSRKKIDKKGEEMKAEKQCPTKIQKKANKFIRLYGGKPEDYNQFVNEQSAKQKEKRQKILRQLQLYFRKDEPQFYEILDKNPNMGFRQLVGLIQSDQTKFDSQRLEKIEKKLKMEKKETNQWVSELKKSAISPSPSCWSPKKVPTQEQFQQSQQSQVKAQTSNERSKEIRQKGKLLMEMKEIFGAANANKIFKFIEANFHLGQEAIVEKYLQQNCNQ